MAKHKKFSLKKKKNRHNNELIKKIARRKLQRHHNSKRPSINFHCGEKLAEDGYENIVLHYLSKLKHLFKPKSEGGAQEAEQFRGMCKTSEVKEEPHEPQKKDEVEKQRMTNKAKALNIVLAALDYGLANRIIGRKGNFFWFKRGTNPREPNKQENPKNHNEMNTRKARDSRSPDKKSQDKSKPRSKSDSSYSISSKSSADSHAKVSRRNRTRSRSPHRKQSRKKKNKPRRTQKKSSKRRQNYNLFGIKKARGSVAKRCHCSICTRRCRTKK